MHAVLLASGRQALIIRVPKSWNPAHAVLFEGRRRYYARNSAGAHEASVEELRAMFTAGATLLDRIREFRLDRMNRIRNASAPVALPGGRMILHVVPFSAFGVGAGIDPKQMHGQYLPPLGQGGFSAGYNFEGFLATNVSREDTPLAYTQVFRNGIIESAAGQFFSQRGSERVIWANEVEYQMIGRLKHYLAALAHAAVAPPFAIMLTLEGMEGLSIVGNPLATMPLVPIRDNVLPFPEVVLEDYGTQQDHARALRPVFDALWNAANYPGSQSYDASGNWAPRRE